MRSQYHSGSDRMPKILSQSTVCLWHSNNTICTCIKGVLLLCITVSCFNKPESIRYTWTYCTRIIYVYYLCFFDWPDPNCLLYVPSLMWYMQMTKSRIVRKNRNINFLCVIFLLYIPSSKHHIRLDSLYKTTNLLKYNSQSYKCILPTHLGYWSCTGVFDNWSDL